MRDGSDDRSLGELFADLAQNTGLLVRQEMRLAGEEISERTARVGREIGLAVAGGVLLHASLLVLLAAIVLMLGDLGLDWWLAALIVAVAVGLVGYAVVKRATAAIKRADILPRRTIQQLKEDQEWVKDQIG